MYKSGRDVYNGAARSAGAAIAGAAANATERRLRDFAWKCLRWKIKPFLNERDDYGFTSTIISDSPISAGFSRAATPIGWAMAATVAAAGNAAGAFGAFGNAFDATR